MTNYVIETNDKGISFSLGFDHKCIGYWLLIMYGEPDKECPTMFVMHDMHELSGTNLTFTQLKQSLAVFKMGISQELAQNLICDALHCPRDYLDDLQFMHGKAAVAEFIEYKTELYHGRWQPNHPLVSWHEELKPTTEPLPDDGVQA